MRVDNCLQSLESEMQTTLKMMSQLYILGTKMIVKADETVDCIWTHKKAKETYDLAAENLKLLQKIIRIYRVEII